MAWNRPTSNTGNATSSSRPSGRGKMPRLRRGLIAGAIVVLGAGLAAWLLMNGEAASSPLQKKERGRIKEAGAAMVKKRRPADSTNDAEKRKRIRAELNDVVKEFVGKSPTNNVELIFPIPDPNDPDNALRTQTMKEVSLLLAIEPGDPIPPYPFSFMMDDVCAEDAAEKGYEYKRNNGNRTFEDELKKWKITAKETDSANRLELKRNLLEAQGELLSGIDEGLSVNDSIRAAYEFRKRAHEMRQLIVDTLREISGGEGDDHADTIAQIKDANNQLEKEGIRKIDVDEVLPDHEQNEEGDGSNEIQ